MMKILGLTTSTVVVVLSWVIAAETVRRSWDHDMDFSKVETFSWMGTQQPYPDEANHVRITNAIERALVQKGLRKAEFEDPDILILYRAGVKKRVEGESYYGRSWEPTNVQTVIDFHRPKTGTLTIEVYDGESRRIVWKAEGTNILPKPDKMHKAIDGAVESIMRHYPPEKR